MFDVNLLIIAPVSVNLMGISVIITYNHQLTARFSSLKADIWGSRRLLCAKCLTFRAPVRICL